MPTLPWPELHGALTHFPIALLLSATAFEFGAEIFRRPEWRVVSFWLLAAAVVSAVPTLLSGWMVGGPYFAAPGGPPTVLLRHRQAAFLTAGLAAALLFWRVRGRDRLAGAARAGALGLSLAVAGAAGGTGFLGGEMLLGGAAPSPVVPTSARPHALPAALVTVGGRLYRTSHCDSCHVLGGSGGRMGPDLTHEGVREPDPTWQAGHLAAPSHFRPGSAMPAYDAMTPSERTALAAFLVTRL